MEWTDEIPEDICRFFEHGEVGVEIGTWDLVRRISWRGGKCGWGECLYMSSG